MWIFWKWINGKDSLCAAFWLYPDYLAIEKKDPNLVVIHSFLKKCKNKLQFDNSVICKPENEKGNGLGKRSGKHSFEKKENKKYLLRDSM